MLRGGTYGERTWGMEAKTRRVVGYVGVGVAAALIAGAGVWAIMSAQVDDAEQSAAQAEETVASLESEVASLSDSLTSAEESLAAATKVAVATATTSTPSPPKTTTATAPEKQFCFMRSGTWEGSTPELIVDYAQLLTGDEAVAAATAAGAESPPPNDYFIVNDNTKLRTLPADPKMTVKVVSKSDGMVSGGYSMAFGEWYDVLIGMSGSSFVKDMPYWITIEDGTIVAIEEQYLP